MQRLLCYDSRQKFTHCQQSKKGENGYSYCKYNSQIIKVNLFKHISKSNSLKFSQ